MAATRFSVGVQKLEEGHIRSRSRNGFLFWSAIIGASVFAAVHTPSLDAKVFKHKDLSWEWGLLSGAVLIFTVLMEMWRRWWGLFTRDGKMRSESLGVGEELLSLMRTFSKVRTKSDLEGRGGHVIGLETEVQNLGQGRELIPTIEKRGEQSHFAKSTDSQLFHWGF